MKILQLSQQFPFPESDGGKIGIANIFKGFSKIGAEVTFLYYNNEKIQTEHYEEAQKYGNLIEIKHSIKNTKFRIVKSIFDTKPLYIRKHLNNKIIKDVLNKIQNYNYDVIHCDHTAMAELGLILKNYFKIPAGLRLHNIEWKIWKRYADELKSGFKYKYINRQAHLLKEFEENIINKFDVLFPITNVDFEYLNNINPKLNIVLANAGVDKEKIKPIECKKNKNELIIATTYNWIHNTNGLI